MQGNIIDDETLQKEAGEGCWDIAVANILADVIIPLQKEIPAHLKDGGLFIASGISNMKEQAVREAVEANPLLEITEIHHQGEWVSVTARKRAAGV